MESEGRPGNRAAFFLIRSGAGSSFVVGDPQPNLAPVRQSLNAFVLASVRLRDPIVFAGDDGIEEADVRLDRLHVDRMQLGRRDRVEQQEHGA